MTSRSAVILVPGAAKAEADALGLMLDFFGVRHRVVFADSPSADDARWLQSSAQELVWLVSATGLVLAQKNKLCDLKPGQSGSAPFQTALVYAGGETKDAPAACELLFGASSCQWAPPPQGPMKMRFSDRHAGLCGPFSGLAVECATGTPLLAGVEKAESLLAATTDGCPSAILLGECAGKQVWFSVSPQVMSLAAVETGKYFDIKQHLLELLPFVMFIKQAFANEIYKTDGIRACLIVDDPTLVKNYGHFKYGPILDEMRSGGFAINVGFIPWNRRRSDPKIVSLVKSNSDRFSIAVHGCDHTRAEFGSTNEATLEWLASTAGSRMDSHKQRYELDYDRLMIFPQGIFSAESAGALKRNNFWAAVNTDVCATNDQAGVPVGEIMDLAITKYGGFPVVTRRYLWHGLENFAFDILLEKPCLVVTHQQDYKEDARHVMEGLRAISKLNAKLDWSTLGEVVQTLHKRQQRGANREFVRLYAHSNAVRNNSAAAVEATFSKLEADPGMLESVQADGKPLAWSREVNNCTASCRMEPGQTIRLQFKYKGNPALPKFENGFVRSSKVMVRRHLSEIRDRYFS